MNLFNEANQLRKELKPEDYRLSEHTKRQVGWLYLIGIVLMVIDYTGAILFPEIEQLRWIGRLAFPIFAYQITQGYLNTSDLNKYLFRIWIFALIAQIPYTLAFDSLALNSLFTLGLGLYLIDRFEKKEYYWIFTILGILFFFQVEYSWYGILLPLLFHLTRSRKWLGLLAGSALTIAFSVTAHVDYQVIAIVGVFLVLYSKPMKLNLMVRRYFFYWFYPIQILVLFLIKMIVISS